ncbi:MAG: patatin-like phospholipase family protein [Alphaproteobacteria bacterium]|nr:patatin-like phospholipase family protein [Alphaproteobacteria bacterium]
MADEKTAKHKRINLALQGGGAHGAFTWGVLDRLLDEEELLIEGISGTSAGAMNAAVLINGYIKDGRAGAKAALEDFWLRVSGHKLLSWMTPPGDFMRRMASDNPHMFDLDWTPGYIAFDLLSRMYSPYDLNPLNINPLREILDDVLDLKQLQACSLIKIFVTATSVTTGQPRIFTCEEITADVLMASSCIPMFFQAVQVGDDHYWDGGYVGNPSIYPLIYNCESRDVVIVRVNPLYREEIPHRGMDIINRLNEITFNSSLIAELRVIDFVGKLLDQHKLNDPHYKKLLMHMISPPKVMDRLNASSKVNASWDFFQFLKEAGRESAEEWLKANYGKIGVESSLNVKEAFLRPK